MTATELRSSAEWQELVPDLIVRDPVGWDRSNFAASWAEPITVEEYRYRVWQSTCSGDFGALDRFMASATSSSAGTDRG